ncbi:MAG TPA: GNAT family N-acetyltransferase [Acidimicrobiales bacterium]|nr:GNAT family N-acetyltransferase [Acidimicrobiales bacterium]
MQVRQATTGDVDAFRDLRLQAMTDAPDCFTSSIEREAARTPADWARWLAPAATFLIESTSLGPAALVAAVPDEADPAVVHLAAMWVHPSLRRHGAGRALVEAVIEWAATVGAQTVRLHVMAGNVPARLLYERCDFRGTGRELGGEGGAVVQVEMERTVSRPHTDEGRRPGG